MKKKGSLYLKIALIVVFLIIINTGLFLYKYSNFTNGSLTGFSIKEKITNTYYSMSGSSKVFLLVQWILLIILLIYIMFKDKLTFAKKDELGGLNLEKILKNSKTDLDALYSILKNKKQLRISTVSDVFKIKKELAMEWGKILEAGNLASIDYPRFGGPIIKIREKEIKPTKEKLKKKLIKKAQ